MSFDTIIANAGRLQILTSLAVEERQEFVRLRRSTQLTDGNLASHARRLATAGMVSIDKQFRDGKPVTHFTLTAEGRRALEAHTRRLVAAISQRRLTSSAPFDPDSKSPPAIQTLPLPADIENDEDWVD